MATNPPTPNHLIRTALDLVDTCADPATADLNIYIKGEGDARRVLAALAAEGQPCGAIYQHATSVSVGFGRVAVFVPLALFVSEPVPQPEMRPLADVIAGVAS